MCQESAGEPFSDGQPAADTPEPSETTLKAKLGRGSVHLQKAAKTNKHETASGDSAAGWCARRQHAAEEEEQNAQEAEAGDQSLSRWCTRRRRTTEEEGQTLVDSAADAEAAAASSRQAAFSGRRSWSPREDQAQAAVLAAESPVDAEGEEEEEIQQLGSEGWRCCKRRRLEEAADTPEDDEELEVEDEPPADVEEDADPVSIGDVEVLETASAAAAEVREEPTDAAEAAEDGEVAEAVDTQLAADGYEDEEIDATLPDFSLPDFALPEDDA
ncbi:aak-1 [Symbiodinium sp. CCMP2592]|nr:aak-1 [Symbiodinium sp. CCMP2592]